MNILQLSCPMILFQIKSANWGNLRYNVRCLIFRQKNFLKVKHEKAG